MFGYNPGEDIEESPFTIIGDKVTNEENYLAQKLARAAIETNNVDHCARL